MPECDLVDSVWRRHRIVHILSGGGMHTILESVSGTWHERVYMRTKSRYESEEDLWICRRRFESIGEGAIRTWR